MQIEKVSSVYDWMGDKFRTRVYTQMLTPSGKRVIDYYEQSVTIYSIKGVEESQEVKGKHIDQKV